MRAPISVMLHAFAAATVLAAPPASAAVTSRWEQRYTIGGRAALAIVTTDGDVSVQAWDQHAVAVTITTRGWRIGGHGVRIDQRQDGDRVSLDVRTPLRWSLFNLGTRALRIEVRVPRESDLSLKTGDGSVEVPDVNGRLVVRTGDGSITLDGARGDLRLSTGDGRIIGHGLDGALEARTGDGDVSIDGRFDALALGSGDGAITAEATPGSQLASDWSAVTGDGRVVLRVPFDLRADLEVHTGDGGIDIDLPVTTTSRVSHHELRGTLNGGGPRLRLGSGDGSIRLEGGPASRSRRL